MPDVLYENIKVNGILTEHGQLIEKLNRVLIRRTAILWVGLGILSQEAELRLQARYTY